MAQNQRPGSITHVPYTSTRREYNSGPEIYQGRPLITSKTEAVDGGVYCPLLVRGNQEAIVIDLDKDETLKKYAEAMRVHIESLFGNGKKKGRFSIFNKEKPTTLYSVLSAMCSKIAADFPYDYKMLDDKYEKTKYPAGRKIQLGEFMNEQNMVCRHMGLLVAAIIDHFKKHKVGFKIGNNCDVRFMGEMQDNPAKDKISGHAYTAVRYVAKEKAWREYYIIDPAANLTLNFKYIFAKNRKITTSDYRYLFSMLRFLFQLNDPDDTPALERIFIEAKTNIAISNVIKDFEKTITGDVSIIQRLESLKAAAAIK